MPGPLPKDPAIRQRRNKSTSRALLPAEMSPIEEQPRLPRHPGGTKWHKMARAWWADVWASPMRYEFVRGDLPALFRLVLMVDHYWWNAEEGVQALNTAKEIRLMEREFGLTPLSRRRLEWQVATAEEAQDRHAIARSRRAMPVNGNDPREALD